MSKFAASILVPQELVDMDVQEFANVTRYYPNIILATAYSEGDEVPLIYLMGDRYDLKTNDLPETPHPRFVDIDVYWICWTRDSLIFIVY